MREKLFISWVGLRGAVPIVLGLYPFLGGLNYAVADFNIAFCVVLVSLVLQGWTVAPMARWLGLQLPPSAKGRRLAEFDVPGAHGREMVVYEVVEGSSAAGTTADRLSLPAGGQFLALVRDGYTVRLGHDVRLEVGDHVYLVVDSDDQEVLEETFGSVGVRSRRLQHEIFGDFVLTAGSRLSDVVDVYSFLVLPPQISPDATLADLFRNRYGVRVVVGDSVRLRNVDLIARRVHDGAVAQVGLKIRHRG